MVNQYIIELREDDSTTIQRSPGDFETTLKTPITLYPNSEVSLKGCFIASQEQNSGRINVSESVPGSKLKKLRIQFLYYIMDWGNTSSNVGDIIYLPDKNFFDGRHYVLCDTTPANDPTHSIDEVLGINFGQTGKIAPNYQPGRGHFGEPSVFQFYFKYLDASDGVTVRKFNFVLDKDEFASIGYDYNKGHGGGGLIRVTNETLAKAKTKTGNLPLYVKHGSFQIDDAFYPNQAGSGASSGGQYITDYGLNINTFQSNVIDVGKFVFNPRKINFDFTIPAKSYTPNDLAETLTRAITLIHDNITIDNPSSNQGVADNVLVTSSQELKAIGLRADGSDPGKHPFFCDQKGERLLQYNSDADGQTGKDYLIGATQFAILFNPDEGAEGAFQILQMHSPLYSKDHEGATIVRCVDTNGSAKFVANKNTGIMITGLYEDLGDGNFTSTDFWYKQLKFDESTILTTTPGTTAVADLNALIKAGSKMFQFRALDGINITGQLKSLDILQIKDTTNFDIVLNNWDGTETLVSATTPINTIDNIVGSDVNSGYYKIELSGTCIENNLYSGSGYFKNIIGLVSRFYEQNSYTSSIDGEGSFTFVMPPNSEPITLSTFRIRILTPENVLAQGILPFNSVFLNIINPVPE